MPLLGFGVAATGSAGTGETTGGAGDTAGGTGETTGASDRGVGTGAGGSSRAATVCGPQIPSGQPLTEGDLAVV